MATILQIETATQVCSAAISRDGKTIALRELMANNIHASKLTLFIQEVMEAAGIGFDALDAVAVSKGPGSYTGLRIGVSTAKGLCFALDKPLIGIDTLKMMAWGVTQEQTHYKGKVCAMIDARRMEVFTAIFNHQLDTITPTNAKIIDAGSFSTELEEGDLLFIGDGAEKCKGVLEHDHALFSDANYNSAANMSLLAYEAFTKGQFEDVAYFEPFYLKDFVFTTPKKKA